MIDLRSDTVTRPTEAMRRAMAVADVGDDVYGEDPTVARLEERVADMFGFEAALFTVTGSLANLLAVRALVPVGAEVLCESSAHIARAEMGAHGSLAGLTMRTWTHPRGHLDLEVVEQMLAPDLGPFLVRTACVSVENTHNFSGGSVQPQATLLALRSLADKAGFAVHLDGARVWNAQVATGTPFTALGAEIGDTMSVCLSKGLGAPIGSLVLASRDQVAEARVWRKRLGAGWRQAGILAAAGLHALDHHIERLAEDHDNAVLLAKAAGVPTDDVDTNMVVVPTTDAAGLVARCAEAGVLVSAVGRYAVRAVTHLDVSTEQAQQAAEVLKRAVDR
ncbi:MAG: threonine aldolase [Nocardioidaceae bacterium]|nr:threonine aldolase [Nocardioidaceae bacterium]